MLRSKKLSEEELSPRLAEINLSFHTPKSPNAKLTNYLNHIQEAIRTQPESMRQVNYQRLRSPEFQNTMVELVQKNPQIFQYLSPMRQDLSSHLYVKLSRSAVQKDWKELVNVRVQVLGTDKNDIHKPTLYLEIIQEAYGQFSASGEKTTEEKIAFVQSIQWGFLNNLVTIPEALSQLFKWALHTSGGKILAVSTNKSNLLSVYTIKWLSKVVCAENLNYVQFITPQNVNLWQNYFEAYREIELAIEKRISLLFTCSTMVNKQFILQTIRAYRAQLLQQNYDIPIDAIEQEPLKYQAQIELSRRKFSFLNMLKECTDVAPYYSQLTTHCRTIYYYDSNEEGQANQFKKEIGKGVSVYMNKHKDENLIVVDNFNDLKDLLDTLCRTQRSIKLILSGHYYCYNKRRGFAGLGHTPEQSATAIAQLIDNCPIIHKLILLGCTTAELPDTTNYTEILETEIATNTLSYQSRNYGMFTERRSLIVNTQDERQQKDWNPLAHNLKMTALQAKKILSPNALVNLVYQALTRKNVTIKGYGALVFEVGQRIVITNNPELDLALLETQATQEEAIISDRQEVAASNQIPFFKSYTINKETQNTNQLLTA